MSSDIKNLLRNTVEVIPEKELEERLKENKPLTIKLGIDPTSPDIHLGIAVVLRKLRDFQNHGHKIVMIIGDFTAMIGDPSLQSSTRKPLTKEQVEQNLKTYKEQISRILDPGKTEFVYNSSWLSGLTISDFISIASKTTVARMIERDDFFKRYKDNKPIGLHEFFYPLMQGYDSVAIKADIEVGGTDQKFNLLMGRELQQEFGQKPQVIITLPILEGTDGVRKMSKSYGNYVGITEPPEEMFGKIMSIQDGMIIKYFKLCTELSGDEIKRLEKEIGSGINPSIMKRRLAKEIINIYHPLGSSESAEEHFNKLFVKKESPDEIPVVYISKDELKDDKIWILNLLSVSGLVENRTEAKRLITQGGVEINGEKIVSHNDDITVKDSVIVKIGKRKFAKILLK